MYAERSLAIASVSTVYSICDDLEFVMKLLDKVEK